MAQPELSLEERYANLIIADDEEDGLIVENTDVVETKPAFVLVRRLLTQKNINFNAMRNVIASMWRPKKGMEIHDLGGFRYSFVFYHKLDLQKVVDGGPWSFEHAMLVYHHMKDNEDPHLVELKKAEIWVQVYDIPRVSYLKIY